MALIATAGATHLATSRAETATEQTTAQEDQLAPDPEGTDFVPSNLSPSLEDAESDNPVIYSDGCHRDQASTDPGWTPTPRAHAIPLIFRCWWAVSSTRSAISGVRACWSGSIRSSPTWCS